MEPRIKQKVREHLQTDYGKSMLKEHGLRYVKKEIFHAIKNFTLGDNRPTKEINLKSDSEENVLMIVCTLSQG